MISVQVNFFTTRGYDPATGQLTSVSDHLANTTAYLYHPATHKNAGQISEIRNAALKSRRFSYNDRGEQTHAWGAAQYPTKTTYTAYGETETLTTYRAGSGWDNATWPAGSEGTGDVTTWQYFVATGLLEFKQDALARKTSYSYRDNGNVNVRTWQRGVTATHTYDGAGLLTGIVYSDGTAPVAITRHRSGEAKTLTDAAGLHTYAYTPAGRTDLETITGTGSHSGITLDHTYAANGIAENLTVTAGASAIYGMSRSFHAVSGLLESVTSGNTLAAYQHVPGSALVRQITHTHNGQAALVNNRRYDALDRLTASSHFATGDLDAKVPMAPLAYTGYQHDALHRRTRTTELDGSFWQYDYNDRSEVTVADKKLTNGTPFSGKQYRHTFDNIGNLTSKETGGDATGANRRTFTTPSNSLNQYASYATPSSFDVLGTAAPGVTVNGVAAEYQGKNFRAQLTAANANANGEWKAVTVTSGASTQGGFRYIAPASFTPTYDLDGNLTDDGEWAYAWDAENRLKTITRTARAQTAGAPYRRVEFTYDAQHRCAERREHHAAAGPVVKTERYIYDGWNRIATLNAANQPQQRFTWGSDLSGGLQSAGGVGGLLWIVDVTTTTTHLACMDGNGNVTTLVNAATKQPTARYEYSPFGDLLRQTGTYAAQNPYRFSTKPQDPTTALLYYGYRWLKPDWNTWTSRDPIQEQGGINLYGFIGNDGVNQWDYLGLAWYDDVIGEIVLYAREIPSATQSLYGKTAGGIILSVSAIPYEEIASGDVTSIAIGALASRVPGSKHVVRVAKKVGAPYKKAGKCVQKVEVELVATKKTSQIDRAAFKAEREAFWKAEAKKNPSKYNPEDLAKMEKGRAPAGPDGHPMELHHVDRTPQGGTTPMSRTDHRLGENYKKNHP